MTEKIYGRLGICNKKILLPQKIWASGPIRICSTSNCQCSLLKFVSYHVSFGYFGKEDSHRV